MQRRKHVSVIDTVILRVSVSKTYKYQHVNGADMSTARFVRLIDVKDVTRILLGIKTTQISANV